MEDRYVFRGKRTDNGEWAEGFPFLVNDVSYILPHHNTGQPIHIDNLLSTSVEVSKSTICQCTGLKDKNGRLIWENGIVDFLGHRGIVKFECGSFGIAYEKHIDWDEIQANIMPLTGCENTLYACENDNYISLWEIYWNFNDEDDSLNTVEVIGNIFDNKELLESEK